MRRKHVVGQHFPVGQRQDLERGAAKEAQLPGQPLQFARVGGHEYPGAGISADRLGERQGARAAVQALADEAELTPKPALVDLRLALSELVTARAHGSRTTSCSRLFNQTHRTTE